MRYLASLLIVTSSFLLALGITQPLMSFDRLFVFTQTPSLVEIITALYVGGDAALAVVVALVSIVFPIAKIALIQTLIALPVASSAKQPSWKSWLGHLSKWSMMDVVLVALAIFAAKTSGLAQAVSQPGLWFYAASALTGAVASMLAGKCDGNKDAAITRHQ